MPKDFQTISLQEGMTIVFPFDHSITLYGLFAVMAFASTNLSGQAVTCQSFLPNIHLSLQSQWEINEDQQELKQVWHVIQGFLEHWIEYPSLAEDGQLMFSHFKLTFSQDNAPNTGVVHFKRLWLPCN